MRPRSRDYLARYIRFDSQEETVMARSSMRLNVRQVKDVVERAVATYLQTAIGLVLAAGMTDLDMGTMRAIAVASIPAALSVIKGWLATVLPVGDDSASMIP